MQCFPEFKHQIYRIFVQGPFETSDDAFGSMTVKKQLKDKNILYPNQCRKKFSVASDPGNVSFYDEIKF